MYGHLSAGHVHLLKMAATAMNAKLSTDCRRKSLIYLLIPAEFSSNPPLQKT